jgi:hypothetical protein
MNASEPLRSSSHRRYDFEIIEAIQGGRYTLALVVYIFWSAESSILHDVCVRVIGYLLCILYIVWRIGAYSSFPRIRLHHKMDRRRISSSDFTLMKVNGPAWKGNDSFMSFSVLWPALLVYMPERYIAHIRICLLFIRLFPKQHYACHIYDSSFPSLSPASCLSFDVPLPFPFISYSRRSIESN